MSHYKKEAGMQLNDLKSQDWFKAADREIQQEAMDQLKAVFTPPNGMENTLLNIAISDSAKDKAWQQMLADKMPYVTNPSSGSAEVGLMKREFFKQIYLGAL